ncbi:hypothetical protein NDN08_002424 [Rhodosorus marinus]|uniref:F-box domain-containing protein n=1 Tax=Rhodosorus marinus TaxID=101924 RepID=A0AAV8UWG4_9RHOD|nr:hypothetical protein NDN08_002424 [Rhodosorus marinus]
MDNRFPLSMAEDCGLDGSSDVLDELGPKAFGPILCDIACGADDAEEVGGDSVALLEADVRRLLDVVSGIKDQRRWSASFMRDHLRTVLARSTNLARCDLEAGALEQCTEGLDSFPETVWGRILRHLDGKDLVTLSLTSKTWHKRCEDPQVWKDLCLRRCRSLRNDSALWVMLNRSSLTDNRWRSLYPCLVKSPPWTFSLHKPGKFVSTLKAICVRNWVVEEESLPSSLLVKRRFDQCYLDKFCKPETCTLYFEPESENDVGYNNFVKYLTDRKRAGLAHTEGRFFVFIPPCIQAKKNLNYHGNALTGLILPSRAITLDWMR